MAAIIKKAIWGYNFVFDEIADPRTKGWFLVAKPYQGLTLVAVYLLFVFKWGPKFMKNRQPYNVDRLMIVYNIVQIIACGYVFINGLKVWLNYRLFCEPVDWSESETAVSIMKLSYVYYWLKIADLADTIFFVLRKKQNQITFLHVYHHTGMVMLVWGAVTYLPGGHGTFVGLINSFVHVVMYSYYLLTVIEPKFKKTIWIKKLVTQIQIIQFFMCCVHFAVIVFIPDCAFPRWTAAFFLPQNLFMLILFLDFYIKTYVRKPKQPQTVRNGSHQRNGDVDNKETNGSVQNFVKYSYETNTELIHRSPTIS